MLELTSEQRARVNRHRVAFNQDLLKGTIKHCQRLYNSGMISEAVEILSDFQHITENEAYRQLLTNQN